MSSLNAEQLVALSDCYTTLAAIYEVHRATPNDVLAIHAAQSMALLTCAFPEISLLEEVISNGPPR